MTLKNNDARKLLDVLEVLRSMSIDMSLERQSIAHKIQALLTKERGEMEGMELIQDMDDDELGWAIANQDPRIGSVRPMHPFFFNFLRNNRPRALAIADEIIRKR